MEGQEDEIREETRSMARGGDEMEERLDELGEGIQTARSKSRLTEEQAAPGDLSGDWEDEASGAQQGEDAPDAFDDPEGEDDDR